MIAAMLKEIAFKSKWISEPIETIYFGGGTPSLLTEVELMGLLEAMRENYSFSKEVEITLEANPDDIHREGLSIWKNAGINRLSIGIQSFKEEDLVRMNRAHSAKEAEQVVPMAKAAGFENVSIDLMFALPFQTVSDWEENLNKAIALNVPHISCYNLTVEEKTALKHKIDKNKWPDVEEKNSAELFQITQQKLNAAGIKQYEISNYAKVGFESKHNRSYWYQKDYVGIGPAAHSCMGNKRFANVAHNQKYIQSIDKDGCPEGDSEVLSTTDQFNEFLLTRLRLEEGIQIELAQENFPKEWNLIQRMIEKFKSRDWLKCEEGFLKLTNAGMLLADDITSQLFIAD